jgi:FkbM family methyltransferase
MNQFAASLISAVPVPLIQFVSRNQWRNRHLRRMCMWGASLVKRRDGVILHGTGKGLKFNVASSHSGFLLGSHETEVQEVLAATLRPGMVYYDVGANVGFFAVIAARLLGESGRVICFEPLPENVRQIEYNARLNGFTNISVRCEALGGSDRTERFQTSAEPTWGSLATVGKAPDKHSGYIEVSVRKLDNLCGTGGLPYPDLMKIDVEGAEIELLPGAMATMKASRCLVIMELHSTNDEIMSMFDKLDYQVAVLGSAIAVRDANWDANIIAAPRERPDLVSMVERFSRGVAVA